MNMKKELAINQIIKNVPSDFSKHCTRDISLLSCSIFGESLATAEKMFSVNFSASLWVVSKNGLTNFYRSEQEYFEFGKKQGEFCKNIKYANKLAKNLIEFTDWFDNFLKQNKKLEDLIKNNKIFFDNYRKFFAYHSAVNWGGDYLANLSLNKKEKNKINHGIKILGSAYKYNEMVVPRLEKYFKKLKINNLLYDEINKNVHANIKQKSQNSRSILFIRNKRIVCFGNKGKQIEKFINERSKKNYKELKEFKGLAVSSGIFTGKVKRILNLNRLGECEKNNILVTTMTRPQFNQFIKQAGAIITDEGGMLCHASILAREFKIPCVVGTKIATKVLKDGDPVKVDANKGTVKILKK